MPETIEYLVACPIYEPHASAIKKMEGDIARVLGRKLVRKKLPPHVTLLHMSTETMEKNLIVTLVSHLVSKVGKVKVSLGSVRWFGKEYLTIGVLPPLSLARLWVDIHDGVIEFSHQEPGPYNKENNLHVTLASKLSSLSPEDRSQLGTITIEPMDIILSSVAVYRKSPSGRWDELAVCNLKD